jgi:hypothetical protein
MRNILRMTDASAAQSPLPVSDSQIRPVRRPRRQQRSCLRCRQAFMGRGPGERICLACKETDSWQNAVAATKGFIEW